MKPVVVGNHREEKFGNCGNLKEIVEVLGNLRKTTRLVKNKNRYYIKDAYFFF